MIPYLPTPHFYIGETRIDAWLILVCVGILAGIEYLRWRAIRKGLSVKVSVDAGLVAILSGFVGAHLVHILAYNVHLLRDNPAVIAPWFGGFSSFGGFLGAGICVPLFLKLKKVPLWAYGDNICHALVLGWFFGRAGCAFAHDHMGRLSDFFLAIDFPGGARHDLGFYEALFVLVLLIVIILLDRKREWFHGFFCGLVFVLYAPVRFFLDFLRATDLELLGGQSDARYLGLTPAQYGCLVLFPIGVAILIKRHKAGREDISLEPERDKPKKKPQPRDEGDE